MTITALSADWSALSLNGPRSRDILGTCTEAGLSNAAFRWLSAQQITVAGHQIWAFRMSYAGELGWELHMPNAALVDVYTALWVAGAPLGLTDYGSFAMNALRMEKGFPGAGELTNEVTLAEANVLRFARTDKDYLGKEKTLNETLPWLCTYLEIEPDGIHDGHGGEAVLLNGQVVGSTASVAYGPTVGKILAFRLSQSPRRTTRHPARSSCRRPPPPIPRSVRACIRPAKPAAPNRCHAGGSAMTPRRSSCQKYSGVFEGLAPQSDPFHRHADRQSYPQDALVRERRAPARRETA